MSEAINNLNNALGSAMSVRPDVGGFPILVEILRQAGVTRNIWHLPSCQSIYLTTRGNVVIQMPPLVTGNADIPAFDRDAVIRAIRTDQEGKSTFPEFLKAAWDAGVIRYEVEFEKHYVICFGVSGDEYREDYPVVDVPAM